MEVKVFAEFFEFVLFRHFPMAIRRLPMVKTYKMKYISGVTEKEKYRI
jgi:hypothetical protein